METSVIVAIIIAVPSILNNIMAVWLQRQMSAAKIERRETAQVARQTASAVHVVDEKVNGHMTMALEMAAAVDPEIAAKAAAAVLETASKVRDENASSKG